jgi:hypothetical protein
MIDSETDEDADTVEDEVLLEGIVLPPARRKRAKQPEVSRSDAGCSADWPPCETLDPPFVSDGETLAWYKANFVDWRRTAELVLRGWMTSRSRSRPRVGHRGDETSG